MNWIKILPLSALDGPDFIKLLKVSGTNVCLVKSGDKLFAVQNRCPHAGADLSGGWCREGHIICPYHRHEFDLETGRGKPEQGNYINTYPVSIRGDGVYLGLKKTWWRFW